MIHNFYVSLALYNKIFNMKRFFTTVVLIAVLCVMSGCKKDGVYRPSQKLSGISEYFERTHQRYDNELKVWKVIHKDSTKRHQTEKWIWNGNRLDRIAAGGIAGGPGTLPETAQP